MEKKSLSYLKKYFGFDSFKNGQEEIIDSILKKSDTLAVMPTGGGKSLCFQIPALIFEGTTLVISPLISLMKDQVDALKKKNIPAEMVNSSMTYNQIRDVLFRAIQGEYKLLYISPERLQSQKFIDFLHQIDISLIAVDEAHCISEWGHDFRPAYLKIPDALDKNRDYPIAAFTATATPEVQTDIIRSLSLKRYNSIVKGFDRPNLTYLTYVTENKIDSIESIIKSTERGSTIIYAGSRKRVHIFGEELNKRGIKCDIYHAGLADNYRKDVQERFANNKIKTIIATNAFGMGIDKDDVRNVIHVDLPSTLEAYYQEAGRAGRDGKESRCIMIYHPQDRELQEFLIDASNPSTDLLRKVYNAIYDFARLKIGESTTKVLDANSLLIGNRVHLSVKMTSTAIAYLKRHNVLGSPKTYAHSRIILTSNSEDIIEFFNYSDSYDYDFKDTLLRIILRYGKEQNSQFDPVDVSQRNNIDIAEMMRVLKKLVNAGLIEYQQQSHEQGILLLQPRKPFEELDIKLEENEEKRKFLQMKLDIVQGYAETTQCKRNYILDYFKDDSYLGECGRCTSCLTPKAKQKIDSNKKQLLLSTLLNAVDSIEGKFGKALIFQFLVGKETQRVKDYELISKPYFGCLSEYGDKEVKKALDSAISEKYLWVTPDRFPTMMLTDKGKDFIGKELAKNIDKVIHEHSYSDELLDILDGLRVELSKSQKLTSEDIIPNNMLIKLASDSPRNILELRNLKGYSLEFVRSYGSLFVQKINDFFAHEDSEVEEEEDLELTDETKRVAVLYQKHLPIDEIANKLNISLDKIYTHIRVAIENDIELNISELISESKYLEILDILESNPNASSREVRESMESTLDYKILRIALAKARQELDIYE